MPALDDIALEKLQLLDAKQQRRVPLDTLPLHGVKLMRQGVEYVSFSGNDYLGLSAHPTVIEAARAALEQYGAGGRASRLITGNHPLYTKLEQHLARMKGTESACIFGSGYLANLGLIPALMQKADMVIADRLSHACMLDGAIASGATLYRFAHNSLAHCREILKNHRAEHANCLIMTETVFSMDGDRAPIEELAALAKEFNAWLMTDDAHGLGIIADKNPADIQMGTLSKAAGSYGGYVCASKPVIDYIKTCARSLIYSTALPPATLAASIAALEIMQEQPELCAKPIAHARLFTEALGLPPAQSAIVPLIIGESDQAMAASDTLARHGFLVQAIRPPTVPPGTARLRVAFSALHEAKDIMRLAEVIMRENLLCQA